jgi:hypothetical protein
LSPSACGCSAAATRTQTPATVYGSGIDEVDDQPHLDGFDDDLLAAYVRGLLEHFELKAANLDPYDATTLSDFSEMMVQDVVVAANGGNIHPSGPRSFR